MRLRSNLQTSLLLACTLWLAACSGQPSKLAGLPERVELNGVPTFRSEAYQSGPTALASMLSQQGIVMTPGLLDKPLHLPGAEADLARNMQVLAREYGLMVYPLDTQLTAVLAQVAAGYPVMARIGGRFWSEAHYVVVVGFNQQKSTVLLRSGLDRRRLMSFSDFESAWKGAGHWAILIQRPSQLPAHVDAQRWRDSANATAQAGQERAAAQALKVLAEVPGAGNR
ncbi:C39 family peptidase [Pseudomonas sp. S1_E04]